ncbi:phosphoserine phosphatase SerB [Bacteroides coprosuis DSM 18011]|uniref:Phosphoserine phosphatase n=1 Tax=Bacteroides coprosuis DSM 18011 TaxID=679937 RepID=F3ZTK1_9BACE|nr:MULTISPECIES: phosphoserine phosphatase SerB [Bacteroides]EGJ71232.1 phosphoserine phosphatase SerB [Bacteroides coprosuis DSM 18011]
MENKGSKLIQIRIAGVDRPGLTHIITQTLADFNATVLDIGQADIHQSMTLGILCQIDKSKEDDLLSELKKQSHLLGVQSHFQNISEHDYNSWVNQQGKNRYILTLLGRKITAQQIAETTQIIIKQKLNIDTIKRLTGRIPLDETKSNIRACVEFSLRGTPLNPTQMQKELMALSRNLGVDYSLQEDSMYRRMRRLICFDMDSTLIQTEVIDELAMRAGVGDQVKAITASAMRGEIDFKQSFKKRVSLLKGLDESVMIEIAKNLPITEGVDRLMYVLKKHGYKVAILSGGFTYFGKYLQKKYDIDYVYANQLEIKEGKLTGHYLGEIVDGQRKVELLHEIAAKEKVDIAQTIAVGDGANDLPMLNEAGLGIAFHAKPKVKENAEQSINTIGLDGVLYFLGFKDSHLEDLGRL